MFLMLEFFRKKIYSYFWFYKFTSENVRRILNTPKTKFFLKVDKLWTILFWCLFEPRLQKPTYVKTVYSNTADETSNVRRFTKL